MFRERLQSMVDLDSPMLNLITWNDYPEGHHIAPEINHNFAYSLLLRHYAELWRTGSAPATDEIAVFLKRYPTTASPSLFNVRFAVPNWILSRSDWEERRKDEDFLEVVTIASSPATLVVNGTERGEVPSGLAVKRLPLELGPVRVQLVRDGETVKELETTEWVTGNPYRGDRGTYAYSTICDAMYRKLFGRPMESSHEYAETDGVPYWKTAYVLK
jgi:hypothetical protein